MLVLSRVSVTHLSEALWWTFSFSKVITRKDSLWFLFYLQHNFEKRERCMLGLLEIKKIIRRYYNPLLCLVMAILFHAFFTSWKPYWFQFHTSSNASSTNVAFQPLNWYHSIHWCMLTLLELALTNHFISPKIIQEYNEIQVRYRCEKNGFDIIKYSLIATSNEGHIHTQRLLDHRCEVPTLHRNCLVFTC